MDEKMKAEVIEAFDSFDMSELDEYTQGQIDSFDLDDLEIDEGQWLAGVCLYADGAAGIHMPGELASYFGIEIPSDAMDGDGEPTQDWVEYEWSWEYLEEWFGELADLINENSSLDGTFYFGTNEGWGDYGLLYVWDDWELSDEIQQILLSENPMDVKF